MPFLHYEGILRYMAPADLDALLELVHDEDSFGSFLHALAADFEADREMCEGAQNGISIRQVRSGGKLGQSLICYTARLLKQVGDHL